MTQGSFISWSIAAAVLSMAPCLHAQEAKPIAAEKREDAPVGAVRVDIATSEDDLLLTIAQPGKQRAVVSCHQQCSFWGAPGNYTLRATSLARDIQYETTLDVVGQRSQFKVSSGDPDVRTVGLVAGS
jgi:hypothetical protein